ncbi:hypothetical protein H3S95_07310 [Bartonella sp. M0193]|uniref:hypothetical protein n=1 Tax=Bartonella TaxID=773 RepID=UPI0018DDAD1C|nr:MULTISPECIES: hypothetical protein [Bartonella]MBI0008443.1 hypothetical protein [Bartonella sp. M0193]MBI0026507.1 hypothetical protein [Bartonella apihabitans]
MTYKVKEAASWLATVEPRLSGAIVPILKKRFSLTTVEAVKAIEEADQIRLGGLNGKRS